MSQVNHVSVPVHLNVNVPEGDELSHYPALGPPHVQRDLSKYPLDELNNDRVHDQSFASARCVVA